MTESGSWPHADTCLSMASHKRSMAVVGATATAAPMGSPPPHAPHPRPAWHHGQHLSLVRLLRRTRSGCVRRNKRRRSIRWPRRHIWHWNRASPQQTGTSAVISRPYVVEPMQGSSRSYINDRPHPHIVRSGRPPTARRHVGKAALIDGKCRATPERDVVGQRRQRKNSESPTTAAAGRRARRRSSLPWPSTRATAGGARQRAHRPRPEADPRCDGGE